MLFMFAHLGVLVMEKSDSVKPVCIFDGYICSRDLHCVSRLYADRVCFRRCEIPRGSLVPHFKKRDFSGSSFVVSDKRLRSR